MLTRAALLLSLGRSATEQAGLCALFISVAFKHSIGLSLSYCNRLSVGHIVRMPSAV